MTGFLAYMLVLAALFALSLWPAIVAGRKGYSRFLFYVFGLFLWPVALIVAYLIKDRGGPVEPKISPTFGPQP